MTQVWAHRGARLEAPENTIPAFERALDYGSDGVEFDVQLTADGVPVVIHDESVERTTDGQGLVVAHSLDQLRQLDASAGMAGFAGTYIPTLAEVLDLIVPSGIAINIELKNSIECYPGLEELVLAAVADYGIADRAVLSTFNHHSLRRLRRFGATAELAVLYSDPLVKPWRYASRLGVSALHPPAEYVLGAGFVRKAHEAGLAVRPWVLNTEAAGLAVRPWEVNSERRLLRMFAWGVDAVFTDMPDVALALRGRQ